MDIYIDTIKFLENGIKKEELFNFIEMSLFKNFDLFFTSHRQDYSHISTEKELSFLFPEVKYITTPQKHLLDHNNSIVFEQNFDQALEIVKNNPFTYVFLKDEGKEKKSTLENIESRIISFKSFDEINENVLLNIQQMIYQRQKREDLLLETIPTSFLKNKDKESFELTKEDIKEMQKDLTIYFDFDDTVAKFNLAACEYINSKLGTNYTEKDLIKPMFFNYLEETKQHILDFVEKSDLYKDVKWIDGAIETLKELNEKSQIYFLTATIGAAHDSKKEMIKKDMDFMIDKIITTNEKQKLEGNILVDDNPSKVISFVEANPFAYCFLIDQPYNQDIQTAIEYSKETIKEKNKYYSSRIIRIKDVTEIENKMEHLILDMFDRFKNRMELKKELFPNLNIENEKKDKKKSIGIKK